MKPKPKRVDPAAEYLDSPLMSQRLLYQRQLSVRIAGSCGPYRTRLKLAEPSAVSVRSSDGRRLTADG